MFIAKNNQCLLVQSGQHGRRQAAFRREGGRKMRDLRLMHRACEADTLCESQEFALRVRNCEYWLMLALRDQPYLPCYTEQFG
jgi:hypothetical protein